jgi:hypothetical protein
MHEALHLVWYSVNHKHLERWTNLTDKDLPVVAILTRCFLSNIDLKRC